MEDQWRVCWGGGGISGPGEGTLFPALGTQPDLLIAHAALDAWAAQSPLVRSLSPGIWHFLRFCLAHEVFFEALPWARTLRGMEAGPGRILLQSPPAFWWPDFFQLMFPGAMVSVESTVQKNMAWARAKRLGVRALRGLSTEWRMRRLNRHVPEHGRVLLVQQARYWKSGQDTFWSNVPEALRARGLHPVPWMQSHGVFAEGLQPWHQCPAHTLFGDAALWRGARVKPGAGPQNLPEDSAPLWMENVDWAPLARTYVCQRLPELLQTEAAWNAVLPGMLRGMGIQGVLLMDENGAEWMLKQAAARAGIPTVAVQHGAIHPDHLHYMYPRSGAGKAPVLSNVTCVYGEAHRDLLTCTSVYPPESVRVTGRLGSGSGQFTTGAPASPAALALRKEGLGDSAATRLLLFTSQDLLTGLVAKPLLEVFAASEPRNALVVRPHPREHRTCLWKSLIEAMGLRGRVRVCTEGPLDRWLEACDAHLSVCSTTLGEAALHGRPNIVFRAASFGDWMGVLDAGVAVQLEDFPSLDAALAHFLDADEHERAALARRQEAYARRYFGSDIEDPAARIAETLARLLA